MAKRLIKPLATVLLSLCVLLAAVFVFATPGSAKAAESGAQADDGVIVLDKLEYFNTEQNGTDEQGNPTYKILGQRGESCMTENSTFGGTYENNGISKAGYAKIGITIPDGMTPGQYMAPYFDISTEEMEEANNTGILNMGAPDASDLSSIKFKIVIPANVTEIDSTAFVLSPDYFMLGYGSKCDIPETIVLITKLPSLVGFDYAENSMLSTIGESICGMCGLTEVRLPGSVTYMSKAFSDCMQLKRVEFAQGITYIDDVVSATGLEQVVIPASVTEIGMAAFANCFNLREVVFLGDGKINFGEGAFENCKSLVKIDLSDTDEIPESMFKDCFALKEIELPYGVESIAGEAFSGCISLERITIPTSLRTAKPLQSYQSRVFGDISFYDKYLNRDDPYDNISSIATPCTALKTVNISTSPEVAEADEVRVAIEAWNAIDFGFAYEPEKYGSFAGIYKVTSNNPLQFGAKLQVNGKTLSELVIPSTVTKVNDGAFMFIDAAKVVFENGVTEIGTYAFYRSAVNSAKIAESVTVIGESAFRRAAALKLVDFEQENTARAVTVKSNLKTIGTRAFESATALVSFIIPEKVTEIGNDAFKGCVSVKEAFNLSSVSPDINGLGGLKDLVEVKTALGDSLIVTAGDFRFLRGTGEKLSELIAYIGSGGDITLPADFEGGRYNISDNAFAGNVAVTRVTIPANSAVNIGAYAFENCTALVSVTTSIGLQSLGAGVFSGCAALVSVRMVGVLDEIPEHCFDGCAALVSVSMGSPSFIGEYAFRNCESLVSVVVPDSVTEIHNYAFYHCVNIKTVDLGSGVRTLGDYSFANCFDIVNLVIPDSVQSIGKYAFNGMEAVQNVYGQYDYIYSDLKSVTIGKGVTVIEEGAFSSNPHLEEINFAQDGALTKIGKNAFAHAYAWVDASNHVSVLKLPNSVTELGENAFNNARFMHAVYLPENFAGLLKTNEYGSNPGVPKVFYGPFAIRYSTGEVNDTLRTFYFPAVTEANRANYGRIYAEFMVYADQSRSDNNGSHVYQGVKNATFVAPSKEAYDLIMTVLNSYNLNNGTSTSNGKDNINYNVQDAQSRRRDFFTSRLFYESEVTFELKRADGTLLTSFVEPKLASGTGAGLQYVIMTDGAGARWWAKDASYALPTKIGAYAVTTDSKWMNGDVAVSAETTKLTEASYTFTLTLASDDNVTELTPIIIPFGKNISFEYNGKAWSLAEMDEDYSEYFNVVSVNGVAGGSAVNVGHYVVCLEPTEGYVWHGDEDGIIALDITPKVTPVIWSWRQSVIEENAIAEKIYDGRPINEDLSIAFRDISGRTVTLSNNYITRIFNGEPYSGVAAAVGSWKIVYDISKLESAFSNYEFTSLSRDFYIQKATVDLSSKDNIGFVLDDSSELFGGTVYIYNDGTTDKPYLSTQTGKGDLTGIRTIENSYARYKVNGSDPVELSLRIRNIPVSGNLIPVYSVVSSSGLSAAAVGVYSAVLNVKADANHAFTVGSLSDLRARGMTIVVNDDGTATVTKTWYIVELNNWLVDASGAEYTIASGWTYGDNVSLSAPVLEVGNAADLVTFVLSAAGEKSISFGYADFAAHINSSMAAGEYTLAVNVDPAVISGVAYQAFNKVYGISVRNADIAFNMTTGDGGYADYEWEYDESDKTGFFAPFEAEIGKTGIVGLVGDASSAVEYKFARLYDDEYNATSHAPLLDAIKPGFNATYIVYFRISAPNHNAIAGNDYFFTVTVVDTLPLPTVNADGLTYTGSKVLPELVEDGRYKIVWSNTDTYIAGGAHSVSFVLYDSVHYRWADADGVDGDTATVTYTVKKAENVFTVALNMLGWNYETFDAAVNNIRAAARYLDSGESIRFRVVKKGETAALAGLDDFGADENGKVTDTVKDLLNALPTGDYTLFATVKETGNYTKLEHSVDFRVAKAANGWKDGDEDLLLPSWIVGRYDPDANKLVINAEHGKVNIIVTDMDGKEYYNSVNGTNKLAECEVGKYMVKAWVDPSADYAKLDERTFMIEVFEKAGLPWWAVLLIVLGSLAVVALVILILWKKGVIQILTEKAVVAMRNRANVDATIASVRAAKRMEEGKQSVAEAKRRERIEQLLQKAKEQRALPPEERAAQLEAKAQADEARAEKLRAKVEATRAKARKMRGDAAAEQPAEVEREAAATEMPETPDTPDTPAEE